MSKRKDIYSVLKSKLSFKNADVTKKNGISPNISIFVNQSLCSYYKFLWSKCKKLWLNKVVESFWVSKGSCRIRLIDNSVKIITHIKDLKSLFPGHAILRKMLVVRNYSGILSYFVLCWKQPWWIYLRSWKLDSIK